MTRQINEFPSKPTGQTIPSDRMSSIRGFWTKVLDQSDSAVYILVGICFLVAALLSLAYGIAKYALSVAAVFRSGLAQSLASTAPARDIIDFVSDLLLTLIIMEVLGTVVHFLRTRETSLKPFLFIGIVSATRGILAVGARLSVTETGTLTIEDFRTAMIELGVNAAFIIALGVTMRLIGSYLNDIPDPVETGVLLPDEQREADAQRS